MLLLDVSVYNFVVGITESEDVSYKEWRQCQEVNGPIFLALGRTISKPSKIAWCNGKNDSLHIRRSLF